MAETIYTRDGKMHVLAGSTTPLSIVREYCGDEVVQAIHKKIFGLCEDIECTAEMSDMEMDDLTEVKTAINAILAIFD